MDEKRSILSKLVILWPTNSKLPKINHITRQLQLEILKILSTGTKCTEKPGMGGIPGKRLRNLAKKILAKKVPRLKNDADSKNPIIFGVSIGGEASKSVFFDPKITNLNFSPFRPRGFDFKTFRNW